KGAAGASPCLKGSAETRTLRWRVDAPDLSSRGGEPTARRDCSGMSAGRGEQRVCDLPRRRHANMVLKVWLTAGIAGGSYDRRLASSVGVDHRPPSRYRQRL